MSTSLHMCVSVRGMLRWSVAETKRNLKSITDDSGNRYSSVDSFRDALMDEIAKGHEVIPLGKACEGFDYKTGCPGHEVPEVSGGR